MKQKTMFIVAAVVLVLVFVIGTLAYKSEKSNQSAQLAERNRANLIRPHSPALGKPDAPVVIVEFIDPACETCREFYPLGKKMMAANPERIRLVLRYAPFQGKFWPTLETLLAGQSDWAPNHTPQVARVWQHLEGFGLDLAQLRADMAAPEIARVIAQDLEDARVLNVTMTPEYFVNGKPLPSFGYPQLKQLVDEALNEGQRR